MVAMFGCAIIIALSILIIICFLIPDTWWILPWAPHQADEDQALNGAEGNHDVRLRDFHQWRPEEEDDPAELMDSRKKLKKPSSSGVSGSAAAGCREMNYATTLPGTRWIAAGPARS
ncbi:hypothetical protein DAPPUDRAFT_106012 [Daphnia pulex]|uniref:Uncharacterized protein n=1 Tax=Daphnia pulex TaxID=6669 RepID=E9GSH5_DAPPU|nr:hypothetical protein DAPPUDRAFT_106012 [Daphnia pulex]|eukprot:EFX77574.1 hypothetical protein DAPPUDRAFT_106012 [Daphnia pulex]